MPAVVDIALDAAHSCVEDALAAAEHADYGPLNTLLKILERPFDDQPEFADFRQPAPPSPEPYRTFCGT